MEKARNKPKERYLRNAIIYFLTCCLVLNTSLPAVMALEAVDVINSSGATPTQWGDLTVIDTDHGAIINWNNFNTSTGQSVTFNQFEGTDRTRLSTQSAVLNRISSGAIPTQFDGALIGNGRVFVVNPAGVVFGGGSSVTVAQLVASGLNMTDDAFNAVLADPGNEMVFQGGAGEVINSGIITAEKVYLVGKKAINRSVVRATNGLIVMAAGSNVFMAQDGSNILIQLSGAVDSTADVSNRSVLSASRGEIILAAGDTLSRAISNAGVINAASGTITARAARIENLGTITAAGDGGSISLTGIEQVKLDYFNDTGVGSVTTNAWSGRPGGTINIESAGNVTITDRAAVQAAGGAGSGDGGSITITAENFSIAGHIDASPGNTDDAPGTLTINTPNITIADGANAGATDTIYEQDIETLSDKGTSLVINSEQGITVPNITDGEIKGRFGNIELYATNADSFITFADTTDTISTTLGDILMGAGSGGISIGNLETARDLSDFSPTPGQIVQGTDGVALKSTSTPPASCGSTATSSSEQILRYSTFRAAMKPRP
jgi:filamentous hemagglutinin family protein